MPLTRPCTVALAPRGLTGTTGVTVSPTGCGAAADDGRGEATLVVSLIGGAIRHWFNLRGRDIANVWLLPAAAAGMLALAFVSKPESYADYRKVGFDEVRTIIGERCVTCHSAAPTHGGYKSAPQGVMFDKPEQIASMAPRINSAVVVAKTMPLANQTFRAYTDLLLHDMGEGLADHRPEFKAGGRDWRTQPLWGLGLAKTVNGSADMLHDGRANGEYERLDPAARGRRGFLPRPEELLPQPVAVLAGELPGNGVHVAQPLHRDQERLVLLEPGCAQLGHLVPEVVLQLVDVVAVERRGPGDVRPPLGDLRFHVLHAHASPRVVRRAPDPGHASFSARVTASHCRRCSASAARPSSVIT